MAAEMSRGMRMIICAACLLLATGFTLPAERTVGYTDTTGESWREEGVIRASVVAARQMWEVALRREGWRPVHTIPLDGTAHKHMEVWSKGGTTLLLCLWSITPGTSGYMWGTMEKNGNLKP